MSANKSVEQLRNSLRHYRGYVFRWQIYKAISPDWDHDHCAGCWARFAEHPEQWPDTVLTEGWVTLSLVKGSKKEEDEIVAAWAAAGTRLVPSPKFGGFQLDWLCPECFEACRGELAFVVDADHPQWHKAGL